MAKKFNLNASYEKLSDSDKNRIGWASTMLQVGRVKESRKFYNQASSKGKIFMKNAVEYNGDKVIKKRFSECVE